MIKSETFPEAWIGHKLQLIHSDVLKLDLPFFNLCVANIPCAAHRVGRPAVPNSRPRAELPSAAGAVPLLVSRRSEQLPPPREARVPVPTLRRRRGRQGGQNMLKLTKEPQLSLLEGKGSCGF